MRKIRSIAETPPPSEKKSACSIMRGLQERFLAYEATAPYWVCKSLTLTLRLSLYASTFISEN
jgi:hypothetical protein